VQAEEKAGKQYYAADEVGGIERPALGIQQEV
jgi:hypothetical protein